MATPTCWQSPLREATEETGIDGLRVWPEAIDLDIHEVDPPSEDPHLHYDVRYLVLAPRSPVLNANHESTAQRWVFPDEIDPAGRRQGPPAPDPNRSSPSPPASLEIKGGMATWHVVDVGEAVDATGIDAPFGSFTQNEAKIGAGGRFTQCVQLGNVTPTVL